MTTHSNRYTGRLSKIGRTHFGFCSRPGIATRLREKLDNPAALVPLNEIAVRVLEAGGDTETYHTELHPVEGEARLCPFRSRVRLPLEVSSPREEVWRCRNRSYTPQLIHPEPLVVRAPVAGEVKVVQDGSDYGIYVGSRLVVTTSLAPFRHTSQGPFDAVVEGRVDVGDVIAETSRKLDFQMMVVTRGKKSHRLPQDEWERNSCIFRRAAASLDRATAVCGQKFANGPLHESAPSLYVEVSFDTLEDLALVGWRLPPQYREDFVAAVSADPDAPVSLAAHVDRSGRLVSVSHSANSVHAEFADEDNNRWVQLLPLSVCELTLATRIGEEMEAGGFLADYLPRVVYEEGYEEAIALAEGQASRLEVAYVRQVLGQLRPNGTYAVPVGALGGFLPPPSTGLLVSFRDVSLEEDSVGILWSTPALPLGAVDQLSINGIDYCLGDRLEPAEAMEVDSKQPVADQKGKRGCGPAGKSSRRHRRSRSKRRGDVSDSPAAAPVAE